MAHLPLWKLLVSDSYPCNSNNQIKTHSVGAGQVEGLSKKKTKEKELINTDNSVVIVGGEGVGGGGRGNTGDKW